MRRISVLLPLFAFTVLSTAAMAQDRPFLFTLTSPDLRAQPVSVHYDAAYGKKTFEPFGGDGVEQNIGVRKMLGESLTFVANVGLALDGGSTNTSRQGELIAHILKAEDHAVDFSAGAGVRHEYSGDNVLLSRVAVGRRFTSWQSYGNLILEKPLSSKRDNIDLTTTFGVSYRLTGAVRLGLEAVGQDLEGFWEENETEGGATVFVGPTLNVAFSGIPCAFTLGGGEIFRASRSVRTSQAMRDLPYRKGNGFIIRNMISFGF